MNQLTLRHIPKPVEKRLRDIAAETGQSINKTVISLIEKALGVSRKPEKRRDLSEFVGAWTKEQADEFEKNTRIFEQIDPEVWQ
jgi:hypothetical protein